MSIAGVGVLQGGNESADDADRKGLATDQHGSTRANADGADERHMTGIGHGHTRTTTDPGSRRLAEAASRRAHLRRRLPGSYGAPGRRRRTGSPGASQLLRAAHFICDEYLVPDPALGIADEADRACLVFKNEPHARACISFRAERDHAPVGAPLGGYHASYLSRLGVPRSAGPPAVGFACPALGPRPG